MTKTKRDLLLHPVRLRLLAELSGRSMTTQQLATALPDIPQATLYRHIKRLVEGSIFQTVAETQVNGAIERTYAVAPGQDSFSPEDLADMSVSEHQETFNLFIATLSERFARYIAGADLTRLLEDGLSYNGTVIYLSEAERSELQAAFMNTISPFVSLGPAPKRKRYTLASIVIPDERKSI